MFSYLLACPKSERHVTCDLHDFTFVTTTYNRDTREETKKDKRKSSEKTVGVAFWPDLACSRLQDGGGKSFRKKKCEKRARSRASYFRFARFNTSPLYYLRAWHRLGQT